MKSERLKLTVDHGCVVDSSQKTVNVIRFLIHDFSRQVHLLKVLSEAHNVKNLEESSCFPEESEVDTPVRFYSWTRRQWGTSPSEREAWTGGQCSTRRRWSSAAHCEALRPPFSRLAVFCKFANIRKEAGPREGDGSGTSGRGNPRSSRWRQSRLGIMNDGMSNEGAPVLGDILLDALILVCRLERGTRMGNGV